VNHKSLSTAEVCRHQAGFTVKPVAHDPLRANRAGNLNLFL
jgi:hypothetical protein